MSTQLHNRVIIFPDGSCGNNTPVADTPPILLENILLDQPKNLRFFTTAIFRPNQHITSISVHRGTQQVLLDFPYSVTDWRWLHTTGSTHTTDSITLPSLKKVRFVSNPQNDRTLRKPTRSLLNPKGWPQPTPSKATKTHD